MHPVPCWEKKLVVPENMAAGSSVKVYKWVRTEKAQQFSEDEEDVDQPLAPLQDVDDVEVIEDEDEAATGTGSNSRAVSEPVVPPTETPSKAPSPKPHPLSVSFQPPSPPALAQESTEDTPELGDGDNLIPDDIINIDMSQLGPDGEAFGDGSSLLQVQEDDAILGGGEIMDETGDPFAPAVDP